MGCYPNYILLISHFDPKNTLILSNDTDFRPKQLTPKFLNIQVFSDNKNLLHKELLRSSSPLTKETVQEKESVGAGENKSF